MSTSLETRRSRPLPRPDSGAAGRPGMGLSRRSWRLTLAATVVAALVAGCVPGTGGTGTGSEIDLAVFGAKAASVCSAGFSADLVCATTTGAVGPASGPPLDGTQAVRFIDSLQAVRTIATFEANSVQLDARCQGLGFAGDWGTTAAGESRFYGSAITDGALQRVPASLSIEPAGDKTAGLLVTLRDAGGRVLLGPLTLLRAGTPLPAAGPC